MDTTAKYFNTISDNNFKLCRFMDCIVDDNLFALVITGEPPREELEQAWNNIMLEYNDALADSESKLYATLLKEVTMLEVRLGKFKTCLKVLRLPFYDEQYAKDLNFFCKTKFPFDLSNREQYFADLDRCERISAGVKLRYQLKQVEFEAFKEKNKIVKETGRPTREYFYKALISLEDYSGLRLSADEISVFQFCERLRRFEKYIKDVEIKERNGK